PRSIAYFNQTVGDRVLFAVDQSTLSPEARTVLQGQANWLNQNPGYAVIIEGHADEQGTREYNLALGARRAAAVQAFLVSQGEYFFHAPNGRYALTLAPIAIALIALIAIRKRWIRPLAIGATTAVVVTVGSVFVYPLLGP
ncbi:MAG: OmpA family protein, partial [Cumulibacter sp.]